jgi:hypothetical protein
MATGLLNSPLFTTIICIVLIFALLSLLVSTLTEAINAYFQERGQLLFETIGRILADGLNTNFGHLLYSHPLVDNLKKDPNSLPQYIDADTFTKALIDVVSNSARLYHWEGGKLVPDPDTRDAFARFQAGITQMEHTPLKLFFLNMLDRAQQTGQSKPLDALIQELTTWYNQQMDRVSGWYKVWIRKRLFWVGLIVAIALNADSIHIFQTIYRSPDLRARIEPIAERVADRYAAEQAEPNTTDTTLRGRLIQMRGQIDSINALGIPVGWGRSRPPFSYFHPPAVPANDYFGHYPEPGRWNVLFYLLGLLITAFSLSAGAPFWFDLLLKLVNLRRTGTKPSTEPK